MTAARRALSWCSGRGQAAGHIKEACPAAFPGPSTSVSMIPHVTTAVIFSSLLDFTEVRCTIYEWRRPFGKRRVVTDWTYTMITVAGACHKLSASDR